MIYCVMKVKNTLLTGFFLSVLFIACKEEKRDLLPDIAKSDSATVMFYTNPPNSRFFTIVKVPKVAELQPIFKDVNASVIMEKQECASWGKIYFYRGTEEVQVVYFSPEESCQTFSFIINGQKFVAPMSPTSSQLLTQLKKREVSLPSAAE